MAARVDEQVQGAKRMIRDMLNYSRARELHVEVVGLSAGIQDGLALVRHAARSCGITVHEHLDREGPPVAVDTGEINQVLVNLASNAMDAMTDRGELTISTGLYEGEAYLRLTDTGPGIAPDDVHRIFTPFFTTKPADRGTGLGLSVCQTLVARHHGRITVESEPGNGSTFTVWLPQAPAWENAVA